MPAPNWLSHHVSAALANVNRDRSWEKIADEIDGLAGGRGTWYESKVRKLAHGHNHSLTIEELNVLDEYLIRFRAGFLARPTILRALSRDPSTIMVMGARPVDGPHPVTTRSEWDLRTHKELSEGISRISAEAH